MSKKKKPLLNAPVTFSICDESGGVALEMGGSVTKSLTVTTDATGCAKIYYAGVLADGATGSVRAQAGRAMIILLNRQKQLIRLLRPVTDVVVSPGIGNGESNISWVDHADNATYYIV